MKMIKNIIFLLTLMLSGIAGCAANEPATIPPDGIETNSLDIGEIADDEITDLRHFTCTLSLTDNKKEDSYNYVEGAICPAAGGECTYSAIMKLNGEITILKQISSEKNTSEYKSEDISLTVKQAPIAEPAEDEEGSDIKATIDIKTKNTERKFNMFGYCGV
jgi:hypothetical protein